MLNQEEILKRAAQAAKQNQGQPAQQGVPPGPAPMSVQIAQARDAAGNPFVILAIQHQMGQSVFHFDPDGADRIADAIKDTARLARTGLEIVR